MKSITKILMAVTLLLSTALCSAQVKNAKTEAVKISGNCGMCKATIEKAGNLKKTAKVNWNADTKMAVMTWDSKKTNKDEILKRIALAGYDSENFLAPDAAYSKLPGCCKYERVNKPVAKVDMQKTAVPKTDAHANHTAPMETKQQVSQLQGVYDNYFAVKDALVKTDGNTASAKAKDLVSAISMVKMEMLTTAEHPVWMKVMQALSTDAGLITATKNTATQRQHFITLSKSMYELMKVSEKDKPVYYQFCPMANDGKGANWLSRENAVKNPYYGSQMMTCGKTVETIN